MSKEIGSDSEVCVHTTVREANDRGYECVVLEDCVGSYFPEFQRIGIDMIKAQGGIFGWVANSNKFVTALQKIAWNFVLSEGCVLIKVLSFS